MTLCDARSLLGGRGHMGPTSLLDERMGWHEPRALSRRGGPWFLGHAKAEVGPGWWSLLRVGYQRIRPFFPEVSVLGVRSLNGRLIFYAAFGELEGYGRRVLGSEVSKGGARSFDFQMDARHSIWEGRRSLVITLRSSLEEASASRCEACGTAVTPPPPIFAGRNNCPACASRLEELSRKGLANPLIRLWEEKTRARYPRD